MVVAVGGVEADSAVLLPLLDLGGLVDALGVVAPELVGAVGVAALADLTVAVHVAEVARGAVDYAGLEHVQVEGVLAALGVAVAVFFAVGEADLGQLADLALAWVSLRHAVNLRLHLAENLKVGIDFSAFFVVAEALVLAVGKTQLLDLAGVVAFARVSLCHAVDLCINDGSHAGSLLAGPLAVVPNRAVAVLLADLAALNFGSALLDLSSVVADVLLVDALSAHIGVCLAVGEVHALLPRSAVRVLHALVQLVVFPE